MSVTGSQSSPSHTVPTEATVPFSTRNRAGFVLAILLSLPTLVGPLFPTPEGEVGPPMLVLALGSVLAAVTIGAVTLAWARGNRSAVRVAAAAIIVVAVTALPAFFAPDVPAGLRVVAAVSVLVSIMAVVLMLAPARPAAGLGMRMSDEQGQSEARSRTAGNGHLGASAGTGDVRRRAGWVAAASAVVWFATLVIEYRYGLFPDQRTGPAVIGTQLLFLTGMLGWAATLVMLLRGRVVRGRFSTFALGLQCAGLLGLVVAGLVTLNSGSQDSALFPIGGLSMILGGILTGIALFTRRALPGRARWVGPAYSGLVLAFLLGGIPPTFASESMLPLAWLVLGVALLATSGPRSRG